MLIPGMQSLSTGGKPWKSSTLAGASGGLGRVNSREGGQCPQQDLMSPKY